MSEEKITLTVGDLATALKIYAVTDECDRDAEFFVRSFCQSRAAKNEVRKGEGEARRISFTFGRAMLAVARITVIDPDALVVLCASSFASVLYKTDIKKHEARGKELRPLTRLILEHLHVIEKEDDKERQKRLRKEMNETLREAFTIMHNDKKGGAN